MKETIDICLLCRSELVFADYVCEDTDGIEKRGKCEMCNKMRYVSTCKVHQRPVKKDGKT